MSNVEKYQRVVNWARARYTKGNSLVISTGGVPSIYSRIEDAAFTRYMKLQRDAAGRIVCNASGPVLANYAPHG